MPPKDDDGLDLRTVDQLDPNEGSTPDPEDDQDIQDDDSSDEPDSQDGEGDDAGSEEPDLVAGDQRAPPDQGRGRASARIRSLTERARTEEAGRRAAERRLDELLRQRQMQDAPATHAVETAAQREERRSRLSPEERIAEDLRDSESRITRQFQGLQYQAVEQSDRTLYETKTQVDPLYKRWQPRVEEELGKLRQRGENAPREAILYWLLGKAMVEQRGGKGNRQRQQQAQRRVAANTTRPSGARSDVSAQRRGSGKSLKDRLADIPL